MGREEDVDPSPQRAAQQEPERHSQGQGSSAAADHAPQQRSEHQRGTFERQPRRSRSRSPPRSSHSSGRHSGSGSRPDSRQDGSKDGRGGERGGSGHAGPQQRRSPDRGRTQRESPGRERSRRDLPIDKAAGPASRSRQDSPGYRDAGPTSRQRSRRSPSPSRGRSGWQDDRSDGRGSRGGWKGDRYRPGGSWEGGRSGRGDWGDRGLPDRGGKHGGWGRRDDGREQRDPQPGPRFMPRVMQQQHPGEERGAYGRRGERPRSRSPPRLEQAPARPSGIVADNPEAAADIVRKMMGGPAPAPAAGAPAPGGTGLSLEQKKKLLWGGKKKESTEGAPAAVFGHNRWDQAELGSSSDKLKFLKLMGGRAAAVTLQQAGGSLAAAEPEGSLDPAFGPAAPWELQQQQQQAAQGPAVAGGADMEVEAATEAGVPKGAAAGPPVAGPAFEGAAPAGPANIMKREGQQRVLSELEREFNSGLARRNRTTGLGA